MLGGGQRTRGRPDPADGRGQLAVLTPAGLARLEQAYPTLLAAVREYVMDHLADLDLAAFTRAMSGIAAPELGPPVRRTPSFASLTNGRQRETTTRPQGAGRIGVPATIDP